MDEETIRRFDRVLETMTATHIELTSAVARLEAVVERETSVMVRVLNKVDALERRIDSVEQRLERNAGWKAGAIATAGAGGGFGLAQLVRAIFGS